jgi:phosphatidate cytidylyltransferase
VQERGRSALLFVPPLVVIVILGGWWITLAVIALTLVAGLECFRLLKLAGYPALPWLGLAIAVAIVIDAAVPTVLAGSGAILAAIGIVLAAAGSFTRADPRDGLNAWVGTVFGALYVGLLAFVVRLGAGAPAIPAGAPFTVLGAERTWVMILILAVWGYDTGAYLVGRTWGARFGQLIGRERFLEHISPSKTYAGLIGGLIATTVVVLGGLWGAGQPVLVGFLLGPIVGLAAQCGDLAESMLKRAAGAKSSSDLIPGHGGVLDRVDSFLLAAPVMTLFVLTFLR